MKSEIPLVILGGKDKDPKKFETSQKIHRRNNSHTLTGYKLVDNEINGKPAGQTLVNVLRQSECFGEIYLAGPKRVYKSKIDCNFIDTDSSLGGNILKSIGYMVREYDNDVQFGIVLGDILPNVLEMGGFMKQVEPYLGADFIHTLIEKTEDMGNSSYKPGYKLFDHQHKKKEYLGGHILFVRPGNLRTEFVSMLSSVFYDVRCKSPEEKFSSILRSRDEFRTHKDAFKETVPYLFYSLLRYKLRDFSIHQGEKYLTHMMVKKSHRLDSDDKHVRILTFPEEFASLAEDYDTLEELEGLKVRFQKTS
tara:strand:+ start:609 stop:1529 length:921 start_codon:yes stop_codon:yes gene_type:complete